MDDHSCVDCGDETWQVHHESYAPEGETATTDMLVSLCPWCHGDRHGKSKDRDGELSPSLRTRMFNKPAEILPEEYVRTDEQVQAFCEACYQIHGAPELTTAEIRRRSRYFESFENEDDSPELDPTLVVSPNSSPTASGADSSTPAIPTTWLERFGRWQIGRQSSV